LELVEAYSPPYSPLLEMDHETILKRVRQARPDLLFVAFGCPKQEKWIAMHLDKLEVPVVLGVGATVDFLAGQVRRAPVWMRRTATEWIFRLLQEPGRLAGRYGRDLVSFTTAIGGQVISQRRRPRRTRSGQKTEVKETAQGKHFHLPDQFDLQAVQEGEQTWQLLLAGNEPVFVDLSRVNYLDNAGLGFCVYLWSSLQRSGRYMALVSPSHEARRVLVMNQLASIIPVASDPEEAARLWRRWMEERDRPLLLTRENGEVRMAWQGEVTAGNLETVRRAAAQLLDQLKPEPVVMDLTRLEYLDSSGAGLMGWVVSSFQRRDHPLRVQGLRPGVANVLRQAGLDGLVGEGVAL